MSATPPAAPLPGRRIRTRAGAPCPCPPRRDHAVHRAPLRALLAAVALGSVAPPAAGGQPPAPTTAPPARERQRPEATDASARGGGASPRAPRAEALLDSAWRAYERADPAEALRRAEAGLREVAAAGGGGGVRASLSLVAGRVLADRGDPAEALPHLERARAAGGRRDHTLGWTLAYLARVRFALGDHAGARTALDSATRASGSARLTALLAADRRVLGLDTTFARWRTVDTPHLRLRISPAAPILDTAAFAEARERAAVRIAAALGDTAAAAAPKRIDLFVWDSDVEAQAAGMARVHFARPALGVTHLTWDQTVGHEIAHIVAYRAARPRTRSALVTEGVAVYFDAAADDRLADAAGAMNGRAIARVDLRALWHDWSALPAPVAYPVAGAVIEMLVREGGAARLPALLREQTLDDARRTYGPALDGWLDALERRLAEAATTAPRTRLRHGAGPRVVAPVRATPP